MEALIDTLETFRPIPANDKELISSFFKLKRYKEGEDLFTGGNICKELFFIVSGIIRMVSFNDKGVEVTHFFIKENQFCTMLQSFNDGTKTDDSIQACCATEALVISKRNLMEIFQQLPYMNDVIGLVNQQRLLEKIRLKNAYSGEDSINRYKVFLIEQRDIAYRLPLKHIASYLGVTPQSLSRIRRNLK